MLVCALAIPNLGRFPIGELPPSTYIHTYCYCTDLSKQKRRNKFEVPTYFLHDFHTFIPSLISLPQPPTPVSLHSQPAALKDQVDASYIVLASESIRANTSSLHTRTVIQPTRSLTICNTCTLGRLSLFYRMGVVRHGVAGYVPV